MLELVVQALQTLEHAIDLALRPLELLRADLRERATELIVQRDEALDARDAGVGDAAVDLAREVDEVIRLSNHVFHEPSSVAGPSR